MIPALWLLIWIALSAAGIALVYRAGLYVERRSPTLGLVFLVTLAPAGPVAGWIGANQLVGVEQAGCEELDPAPDRLHGLSPSEFRSRCVATQDNSEWLARRKL
jgi:hypothetical protein